MNSSLRPFRPWQFLITGLLIAVIVAVVLVWVNRGAPTAIALSGLDGEDVHTLVAQSHDDGARKICGEDETAHIATTGAVAHGLDSTSEVPAEAVSALEESGGNLDDHEQRHFDTHRLLLISWDPTSVDLGEGYGPELGSVYELHYLEDETSIGWGVVYAGSVFECPADWPD